ncbi:glycosyl transferase family 2 [Methyloglobulus morosus KoM1]|uniref:Glycosyl transferase family 2 n=1 Tax=Methyloglobulus morosus KoM1 TaxID=1116472 RepID=V5BQ19_9GAMM|nr:glycosyltransferase [Methyloglobulus morosus]ESS66648.1 glycosyl transferase family 2 [Methyloglobulus morosus KoM1]
MNKHGQAVCLNMIVKDEAHIIHRCLASVRPLIDSWLIVDTGSTDGTQAVIREILHDVPGEIVECPWVNFAHNRTEALELARGKGDYLLIMDADDTLEIVQGFELPVLTADAYCLEIHYAGHAYRRRQLIRNALPWRYVGVLHEYLSCPENVTEAFLPGLRILPHHDGARARDPNTYRKDAALLEQGLIDEPDNSRYVFYLAQSYRDAGENSLALKNYQRRLEMGGWEEEIWFSLHQVAVLQGRLGLAWEIVLHSFLAACEYKPDRAEPLFHIAMHYQQNGQYSTAYSYFSKALTLTMPTSDRLFVEIDIYRHLTPLNCAVCCYYLGKHNEAITLNKHLLDHGLLPENLVGLVTQNLKFSLDAVGGETILTESAVRLRNDAEKRINLGCGRNNLPGWINLDSMALPGVDVVADLEACATQPLPFEDNSIGEFLLSHVLEHIHNTLPLMQELWRIAKPNALMTIRIPHGGSDDAWEDPTHVRAYYANSFGYFSQPFYWRADYGYRGDWRVDKLTYVVNREGNAHLSAPEIIAKAQAQRNVVQEMIVELSPVKPIREPKRELQDGFQIAIQFSS